MPRRKHADLAHLSPEEYRIEANKRTAVERKGYFQVKYIAKKDKEALEESKKRLEEAMAAVNARLAELGSPQLCEKINSS
jgi:hypothetical protein